MTATAHRFVSRSVSRGFVPSRLARLGLVGCLALLLGLTTGLAADLHAAPLAQDDEAMEQAMEEKKAMEGEEMAGMDGDMAAMMTAWAKAGEVGEPHQKMAEGVGAWNLEMRMYMPGAPPMVSQGKAERSLMMGGRVLREEVTADIMGTPMTGLGLTGYDNVTEKYWSVWMDNMTTGVFTTTGDWKGDDTMVFTGQGADPMTGEMMDQRIEIHYVGEGKEEMKMYMPGPDGEEMLGMEIIYTKAE